MQASQYRYHVSKFPPFSREQEQAAAYGIRRLRDAAWETVLLEKTPEQVAAAFTFPEREVGDFAGREQERAAAALFTDVMAGPAWASWSSLSLPANRTSPLLASGLPSAAHDLAPLVSACDPDLIVLPRAGGKTGAVLAAVRDFEAHNVGLCFTLARRFHRPGLCFEIPDLAAFAFEGLRTAVLRFDPDKGFRFSTFASNWVRHKIGRAIDDLSRPIRLPVHALDTGRKIAKIRARIENATGAPASVDQVAEEMGIDHCKVHKVATLYTGQVYSLDQPTTFVASDNAADRLTLAGTLHDESTVAADEGIALTERAALVREAIQTLTEKQRLVLGERLMAETPATLKDVGKVLRVSRERVRQIESESLGRLRGHLLEAERMAEGRCVRRRQAQREVAHA